MRLIIASNNAHKVREIKEILGDYFSEILSLKEAGIAIDVEEDGETYLTMIEDDDEFEEVYQAFEERLSDLFFDDERTDSESEEDGE